MARKNFKATGGINIDTSTIPTSIIQETITSNSATTVDTIALDSFLAAEYTVTLTQGSKIRTSKVIMQTDGSSVDMTEFAITETGGTMSGVVVSATTASTNAVLQITVTDAASTLVRYKLVRNITAVIGYEPDAPTNVVATFSGSTVSVAFTAPEDTGNSSITSYTAVSNTGNFFGTASSSPITVSALTGTYTFTVTATNEFGTSEPSSASAEVVVPEIPKATGGTITSDSVYFYHTFTSSDNFTPLTSLTADYLIVAGGGAAKTNAGSGGAGGYRTSLDTSTVSLSEQAYPVVVGAGGASRGAKGTNSSAFGISSTGGGSGSGAAGGSGGGAGGFLGSSTGGSGNEGGYDPVEGYSGGNNTAPSLSNSGSAGGGGAGGAGSGTSGVSGGSGGIGRLTNSDWGLVTETGENISGVVYYAGGGGGFGYQGNGNAEGGFGGGGNGNYYGIPENGMANTGGGGGAGTNVSSGAGGRGGSGIVIVRYAKI